ncbi:MAG: hypothetical protein DWQ19_11660 [Crenarchaeota archaeon]|nr:MAG: hypothetical protein DWQ19_11660 [Thermoproteota archaeon]
MIEITNITKGPIQLIVKSLGKKREYNKNAENKIKGKAITVVNIPGIGSGKNIYLLEDERYTDYIDRAEKAGFIKQRKVTGLK